MHTFATNLAEIAILAAGIFLLLAWITYTTTTRIKESLYDLTQDDLQATAAVGMESKSRDFLSGSGAESTQAQS